MSLTGSGVIQLNYGRHESFSCEMDAARVVRFHCPPQPNPRFREDLRKALEHPLDFPPIQQAFIPDDRVVLALDRHTPESPALVAEVWRILQKRGVSPENVLIIQPALREEAELADPRSELPDEIRQRVRWKIHDPADDADRKYLATTTNGERVYLAREVTNADIVIAIGFIAFDPVIGYRGTSSVFYPGLSSPEAFARALGQGHSELGPTDERPMRQMIDEVAWLLGTQFSIQVVPSSGGGASRVLAGICDTVYRHGKRLLDEQWMVQLDHRPDIVVAAVDQDAAGHGWKQVAAALSTARNLVRNGGKIVILSQLQAELGAGLQLIRECENPRDAFKPLRNLAPPDLIAATQVADAVDWANVYLLSQLESDLAEELFFIPLASQAEIMRLLAGDEACVFLGSAQKTYGQVQPL